MAFITITTMPMLSAMSKALLMLSLISGSSCSSRRAAGFVVPTLRRWAANDVSSSLLDTTKALSRRRQGYSSTTARKEKLLQTKYIHRFYSSNFSSEVVADVTSNDELKPFSWSDIIALFRDSDDSTSTTTFHNYISSDHPKLALFRRSPAAATLYEDHKQYIDDNWKSGYDYLVYSKFGKEFGFEKELIHVTKDDPTVATQEGIECNSNYVRNKLLEISPEGYRYQCNPSLSQASDFNIKNGITFLKLVPNDFPYDVEEGIQHWCLWKIGGSCRTEGILMEEIQWALQELNSYDGNSCSSSGLIKQQNELSESAVSNIDKFSTFFWVNPPHLQSMPEIHHAHILCKPNKMGSFASAPPV
jgi:hypothetical protein